MRSLRLLALALAVAIVSLGCVGRSVETACQASAAVPTPVTDGDMAMLETLKSRIFADLHGDASVELWLVDADEAKIPVLVLATQRTALVPLPWGPALRGVSR